MKEFLNVIEFIFMAIYNWIDYFLGGFDGISYALFVFVVIDYITGVMCAMIEQNFYKKAGIKVVCQKVMIFLVVGIANILDVQVIDTGAVLRTVVILFYLYIEGISLLDNVQNMGLPIPEKIKIVLRQLHDRNEKESK